MVGREDNAAGRTARFANLFTETQPAIPGDAAEHPWRGEQRTRDAGFRHDRAGRHADRLRHNAYTDPKALELLRTGRYLIEANLVCNQLLVFQLMVCSITVLLSSQATGLKLRPSPILISHAP